MKKQFLKYRDFLSLNESKATAKRRWLNSGKIDIETFNKFVKMDPSKSFKYVEKLIEFYLKENIDPSDLEIQIKLFHKYVERNLINVDIQRLSHSDFTILLNSAHTQAQSLDDQKEKLSGVQTVLDTENYLVVIPDTEEASCKYGAGTKWCTAATKSENYFNTYRYKQNVTLYYIIDKNTKNRTTKSKIAVAVYPDGRPEIYNSSDNRIDIYDIPSEIPKDIFIPREPKGEEARYNKLIYMYNLEPNRITRNSDGSIDYDGDVNMSNKNLTEIPFKFRKVTGNFDISDNLLTSLKNCAIEIEGRFSCSINKLKSLEFGPQSVGRFYDCSYNEITTLEHLPKDGNYELNCSKNELKDLSGGPLIVNSVVCRDNPLESLRGIEKIKYNLLCDHTHITTLEGMPYVGRDIILYSNKLVTLKGIQSEVYGTLDISYNRLQNIEYLPTKYNKLECEGNPGDLEKLVDSIDNTLSKF